MMRGAKGIGMGELLAKRPSILIMSICSLYHIFYVGISDIACNEFTKRSTRDRPAPGDAGAVGRSMAGTGLDRLSVRPSGLATQRQNMPRISLAMSGGPNPAEIIDL